MAHSATTLSHRLPLRFLTLSITLSLSPATSNPAASVLQSVVIAAPAPRLPASWASPEHHHCTATKTTKQGPLKGCVIDLTIIYFRIFSERGEVDRRQQLYVHFGQAVRTTFHPVPPPPPSATAMTTDGCLGHRPVAGSNPIPPSGRAPLPAPPASGTTTASSSALASRTSRARRERLDPLLLDLLLPPGPPVPAPTGPIRPNPDDDAVCTDAVLSVRPAVEPAAPVAPPPPPSLDGSDVDRRRRPARDPPPPPAPPPPRSGGGRLPDLARLLLLLDMRIDASLSCILAMPWSEIRRVRDRPLLVLDRREATDADPPAAAGGWTSGSCRCPESRRDGVSDAGTARPADRSRRPPPSSYPRVTSCRLEWNDRRPPLPPGSSRSRDRPAVRLELRPGPSVLRSPVPLLSNGPPPPPGEWKLSPFTAWTESPRSRPRDGGPPGPTPPPLELLEFALASRGRAW